MERKVDTAFKLKKKIEDKEDIDNPIVYLEKSEIVQKYSELENLTDLGKIFALIGLSEIPYSHELAITKELVAFINSHIATNEGFSYTRKAEGLVPCYNAMLLEAYCKLGLGKTDETQKALNWIKQYQLFERNKTTTWRENGICKHGGCLKKTPCYIGIGKTIRALIAYQELVDNKDEKVEYLLEKGTNYMLNQKMYKRLSNGEAISAHITDNMFPQSYALSLTDIVYITGKRALWGLKATKDLRTLIESKRTKKEGWKNEYIYKYKGYIAFDNRRQESPWITDIIENSLKDCSNN
ncbi:hypothetical protein RV18_GL001814 [Enterococcus termitis]|nr:hypothetical protein RV18_GL001814 [Enterococcus termitis]